MSGPSGIEPYRVYAKTQMVQRGQLWGDDLDKSPSLVAGGGRSNHKGGTHCEFSRQQSPQKFGPEKGVI